MIRSPVPNQEEHAKLARLFFFGGWLLLPLLWVVSTIFLFAIQNRTGMHASRTESPSREGCEQ